MTRYLKRTSRKKNVIYISLIGRIGNNLFQIATAASLAKKYNCNYIAIPYPYRLSNPDNCLLSDYLRQFENTMFQHIPIETGCPAEYVLYKEPYYHYQEIPWQENIFYRGISNQRNILTNRLSGKFLKFTLLLKIYCKKNTVLY